MATPYDVATAIKQEKDVDESSWATIPPIFIKHEPEDDYETPSLQPIEQVSMDLLIPKTEPEEEVFRWQENNPDVDPLLLTHLDAVVKEEPDEGEVTVSYPWVTEAVPMPVRLVTKREENEEAHLPRLVSSANKATGDKAPQCVPSVLSCPFCEEPFFSKQLFSKHLAYHGKERHCLNPVASSTLAEADVEKVPQDPRKIARFICDYCEKPFSHKGDFRKHVSVHMDERPYSCPQCPQTFRNSSNLFRHVRYHSDARPFACPVCQRALKSKSSLQRHIMTHTGSKPFPCALCPMRFTTRTHVERHQYTHMEREEGEIGGYMGTTEDMETMFKLLNDGSVEAAGKG